MSSRCPKCGGHLEKVHRTAVERIVFSSTHACRKCHFRSQTPHHWWYSAFMPFFSRYTICVKCGTTKVYRMKKRDPLDHLSKHPLSLIQQMLFAPRNRCVFCRMQYHDLRPLAPDLPPHTRSEHSLS
jgi:predicted RNA-binding Zn-ribbon protein involved in translation (DUF1610 family)